MASEVLMRERLGAQIRRVLLAIDMDELNVSFSNLILHSFEGKTQMLGAATEFASIQLLDDHLAVSVRHNSWLVEFGHVEEQVAIALMVARHVVKGVQRPL